MKKSVVIAVLGLAAGVATSYGQGQIHFDSYTANGGSGIQTMFGGGPLGTGAVGAGYTAALIYSTSPIVDSAGNGALNGGFTASGVTSPFLSGGAAGYFTGPDFILPSYSGSALVYFEVIAYQTSAGSYAAAINRGHSDVFSQPMATGINSVPYPTFTPFTVTQVVPEPTTLALAGLGSLSLLLFRRKQV